MLAQEFLAITVHVQGRFPLSRNFYVCTSVKLTCVNKTEAMYGRSRTNVKAELRPTFMFSRVLYFIYGSKNLRDIGKVDFHCHVMFTCANKIEAMYEVLRVNVKVERGSTLRFTRNL